MIFGLLLGLLMVWDLLLPLPVIFYILTALAYLSLLFYGSYSIRSGFYLRANCRAVTEEKQIALSFDDGPGQFTKQILEVLDRYQVPATFFCIGRRIENDPVGLKKIFEAGHSIGNHSYHHSPAFDFWTTAKVRADLQRTSTLIRQVTGRSPAWFRPPYGVTNPRIAKAVHQLGYQVMGWSVRSLDTQARNPEKLLNNTLNRLHPGAIVLFHDTMALTLEILPRFIQLAQERGYEIVAMDKLLNLPAYAD
ncbi:polysaccharide deacetylase family protein [Niabella terrae]